MSSEPLVIGYVAPLHGRGAMGFVLLGLFALIVLLAGALSPSLPLILAGAAGTAAAATGFAFYWRTASKWPMLVVFGDRLEIVRGPQRGMLAFDDVLAVRGLEWSRSLFPYQKEAKFLVLQSAAGEWQFGPEIAAHVTIQETIIRLVNEHHAKTA